MPPTPAPAAVAGWLSLQDPTEAAVSRLCHDPRASELWAILGTWPGALELVKLSLQYQRALAKRSPTPGPTTIIAKYAEELSFWLRHWQQTASRLGANDLLPQLAALIERCHNDAASRAPLNEPITSDDPAIFQEALIDTMDNRTTFPVAPSVAERRKAAEILTTILFSAPN